MPRCATLLRLASAKVLSVEKTQSIWRALLYGRGRTGNVSTAIEELQVVACLVKKEGWPMVYYTWWKPKSWSTQNCNFIDQDWKDILYSTTGYSTSQDFRYETHQPQQLVPPTSCWVSLLPQHRDTGNIHTMVFLSETVTSKRIYQNWDRTDPLRKFMHLEG